MYSLTFRVSVMLP